MKKILLLILGVLSITACQASPGPLTFYSPKLNVICMYGGSGQISCLPKILPLTCGTLWCRIDKY